MHPPVYITHNLRIYNKFQRKSRAMSQNNLTFDVEGGQVFIFSQDSVEKIESNNQETSLQSFQASMMNDQSSIQNDSEDGTLTNVEERLGKDFQSSENSQSLISKKKRNTQNTIRTILRSSRIYLENKNWTIDIKHFFESQKQLYLLAVFRKQNQFNRLQQLKTEIRKKCKIDLQNHYKENNKELKLQLHLKFFLQLTQEDLDEANIKQTIERLGQAAQFKKHPTKLTPKQLYLIESKFLSQI